MSAYGLYALIVTVAVMIGIAVFILLFERRRAREIERDLHDQADRTRAGRRDDEDR